jgi:hypothetical protein
MVNGAWINRGDHFEPVAAYAAPALLASRYSGVPADTGTRFADLNGDGLDDVIQSGMTLAHPQDATPSQFEQHRVFLNAGFIQCGREPDLAQ